MEVDIEKVINELFSREMLKLKDLIRGLGIPADVFRECWRAGEEMDFANESAQDECEKNSDLTINSPSIVAQANLHAQAHARFMRLLGSSPNVRQECINAICAAYGTLQTGASIASESSIHEMLDLLLEATTGRGMAYALSPFSQNVIQRRINSDRNIFLAAAGSKGASVKNTLATELKAWAIAEGKKLKGLPTAKARLLMDMLPANLDKKLKEAGDKLKDPQRVIREALVKQRNESSTASQPHVTGD